MTKRFYPDSTLRIPQTGNIHINAANPPTISIYTFAGTDHSIPVYVPKGSADRYRKAEYWNEFTNFVEE